MPNSLRTATEAAGKRIKVVQITTVHPAFDVRIFHKECQALAAAGFDVVLIAPHDRCETVDDVRIIGLRPVSGRIRRVMVRSWSAYRMARRERAMVYHFHDPELLVVGLLLKWRGARVFYDVHEDVPRDLMLKRWIPRVLRQPLAWFMEWLERLAANRFDAVVAATPHIAERFPVKHTLLVRNYPLTREIASAQGAPYFDRPPHIVYVGTMHENRGLYTMAGAIEGLSFDGLRLRLVGILGPEDSERLRQSPAWPHIDVIGWCDRTAVTQELLQAKLGLVLLHPVPTYVQSLPVKLFEYMAAGMPVLASDFPLWRSIIEDAECGMVVDPLNVGAIRQSIQWLLDHPEEAKIMGERGRRAVRERYTWEREGQGLIDVYRKRLAG